MKEYILFHMKRYFGLFYVHMTHIMGKNLLITLIYVDNSVYNPVFGG